MCSSRRRSCPVLVSVENWAQLRNSKNIPTSTSRFRQQPPYCSLVSKQTREETHRLRSNHRRRRRKLISKSIVSSFEWLLMETLSWIAANTARFSKSRERWTSYRKLRRCKRSSIVNTVPQKGFAGVSMKDSFLFNCIEGCNNNNSTKVSERKNGNETERKLTSDTSHVEVDRDHRVVNAKTMLKNPKFKKRDTKQSAVDASLIIGDSAIEIQEVGDSSNQGLQSNNNNPQQHEQQQQQGTNHESSSQYEQPSIVLGSTSGSIGSIDSQLKQAADSVLQPQKNSENQASARQQQRTNSVPAGPLPPLAGSNEATTGKGRRPDDITDGDKNSRNSHDYDINELNGEKNALGHLLSTQAPSLQDDSDDKAITGKVVDFELTPAGGHNKAKIKKKKKKKKKKEEEEFKKWGKKKKSMKKKSEMKKKEEMKKKKEEGKKKKKKWGLEEHGQKKKGNFKKKKWGKKVKKGKGVKKGKKGKKFLKDKGHKNTGFKKVYHKEEWGKSSKWHDIKREKKWDEASKKWKKKWKKEKGKKYKGDHMKKFEKKKKSGKKYKKEKKEKFKKEKAEKFKKGSKKMMEEHAKKKEGGKKQEKKEEKKKKKKKKG